MATEHGNQAVAMYVRTLEGIVLALWAEMPPEHVRTLADANPDAVEFVRNLFTTVEHENLGNDA